MSKSILIGIFIVILVGLFLAFIISKMPTRQIVTPVMPTPTELITQAVSPPPTSSLPSEISGQIFSIEGNVGFNNSLLIIVDNSNVYITPETEILDQENQPTTKETLREDMTVEVTGNPAEGGIEATQILIVSKPSPTI